MKGLGLLIVTETGLLGHRNSSHQCGARRGGANCLGRWKVQNGTERDEGDSQNQVGDRRLTGRVPLPAQHTVDVFEEGKRPDLR